MKTLRRNATRARVGVCLAVVLVMAACTGNPTQPPLTDLHLPGVRKIANLDALQRNGQIIYAAAAYSSAGSSDTRVIFEVAGQLYSIELNGGGLRAIKGAPTCFGPLSVSADGRWVACDEATGVYAFALDPDASLKSFLLLRDTYPNSVFDPIWSPDGNMFAVIDRSPSAGCAIDLYRYPLKRPDVPPTATLTFPTFMGASGTGCDLNEIAWSRDGAWLALAAHASGPNSDLSDFVLSLANLVPLAGPTSSSPADVTVVPSDLVFAGGGYDSKHLAWSGQGAHQLLTIAEQNLRSIVQVEPATGARTPLLNFPVEDTAGTENYGFICSMAWTPDGARLIFVDCAPGNIEVRAVPSKLYVYTPPGA